MEKLVAGYRYLADLYAKGIEVSGEEGDDCTQDIFIANKTDIEKYLDVTSQTWQSAWY